MTPLEHYFFLPPILLTIHGVLLLPVFLPPWPEGAQSPPVGKNGALNLNTSILYGVAGFFGVVVAKQLAVRIPLPKSPGRVRLTAGLEWTILYMLGFLEEVWRWCIVRVMLRLEGRGDGFAGSTQERVTSEISEGMLIIGDGIWKELYLMGWIWCLIESGVCMLPLSDGSGSNHLT